MSRTSCNISRVKYLPTCTCWYSYQTCCLKVGGSVVSFRNKQLASRSILVGLECITHLWSKVNYWLQSTNQIIVLIFSSHLNKFLLDGSQEVEAWLNLGLGVVSLHCCRDHGNEPSLGGHLKKCEQWNCEKPSSHCSTPGGCRTPWTRRCRSSCRPASAEWWAGWTEHPGVTG